MKNNFNRIQIQSIQNRCFMLYLAFLAAVASDPITGDAAEKKSTKTNHTSSGALAQNVLWDSWYIVTLNDSVRYAYYNEKAEITDGRAHLQLRIWKKEEGVINEENIGAFSKDNPELTPLFYNYRQVYKTTETLIDGTIDEDRSLVTKVKKNGKEPTSSKKHVPAKTILSYMFPIWLAKSLPTLKPERSVSFYALAEDQAETGFPISTGTVTLMKPDEVATKTGTQRIRVVFSDADSFWWVRPNGNAVAIHTPLRKTLIQLVSKEKALSFLK